MSHFGHVNSYDPNAPLPRVGTHWVWEIDSPNARAITEVTAVRWNGEEWWVETRSLTGDSYSEAGALHLNDIGRFWEAVTAVGGAITGVLVERRPDLTADLQETGEPA